MTTIGVGDGWVANELRIVQKNNIPFRLHALNAPAQTYFSSEDVARIGDETNFIYPLSKATALLAFFAAPFKFRGRFFAALWNALTGERESFRNRIVSIWHLVVACHWAATLDPDDVDHIHSQWIHSAGTVAMYGAWLLGKPFSFTGHAADLFRNRVALRDKIKRAEFIVCISEFHRKFFLDNGAKPEQLFITYCGINPDHFKPNLRTRKKGEPVHILSSGRLVEKKGFDVLIEACKIMEDRGFDFRCTIGGSGPLEQPLKDHVQRVGLGDKINVTGQLIKQEDIPTFMADGDIYALHCVWSKDNDVDGLPQMLMEAMACGLPAISTYLVGIPDLVAHEKTGLLVQPGDAEGLADAIMRMEANPTEAKAMADAALEHLSAHFDLADCVDPLLNKYRAALEQPK